MPRIDPIANRLEDALARGTWPTEMRLKGQQLVAQLSRPPRIAVFGLAGSGKTGLINMLLGAPLMPSVAGVPVSELCQGEAPRVHVELADRSTRDFAGCADQVQLPAGAVRVIQELPDARLGDWSFLELSFSGSSVDEHELLRWAARRADIAIWCTQAFDDRERSLWAGVPDHLKDHGFLALTKADQLFLKSELSERILALQPVVEQEFLCLHPLATMQAIAARRGGDGLDQALWKSSGGASLFERIRRQIEQARSADLDQAAVLLDRCRVDQPLRGSAAAPAKPAAKPEPVAELKRAGVSDDRAAERARAEKVAIETALGLLRDCATELMNAENIAGVANSSGIFERCNQVASDLVAVLSQQDDPSPDLARCRDDAIEGEEMLMLLQLERGEDASLDAVTVLFQLKKEISERVAR